MTDTDAERDQLKEAMLNFTRALADPVKWCCSGRCRDTNWMGHDRLHYRSSTCPPSHEGELLGHIATAEKLLAAIDYAHPHDTTGLELPPSDPTVTKLTVHFQFVLLRTVGPKAAADADLLRSLVDKVQDWMIDDLHGPGAADALNAAIADGSIYGETDDS